MKRQINFLLIVGAVLLIGMSSCEKKKDPVVVGNISGIIINSQTGDGLSNATISLTQDASATSGANASIKVITDASGYFIIEDVPVGTYIWCVGHGSMQGSENLLSALMIGSSSDGQGCHG